MSNLIYIRNWGNQHKNRETKKRRDNLHKQLALEVEAANQNRNEVYAENLLKLAEEYCDPTKPRRIT